MIEIVADCKNLCGEAPLWDARRNCLWWVDISGGMVFAWEATTKTTRITNREMAISGLALNRDGRLLFAGENGLSLWSELDGLTKIVATYDGEDLLCNDLIADVEGRIYFGTSFWERSSMRKHGKLYMMNKNGSIQTMDEGIELANGLGLSPDGRILYFADSTSRKIYSYDVNAKDGWLSNRRTFVSVPLDEGIPDGLTVDADGHVWSAQWYGGQVVRYDPDGKAERRIEFPVKQISSLTFGGDDLTDLYVTSAAEPWPSVYMPAKCDLAKGLLGGPLFRLRLDDIRGCEEKYANFSF